MNSTLTQRYRCSNVPCAENETTLSELCPMEPKRCCVPDTYTTQTVQCDWFELELLNATSCSCQECPADGGTVLKGTVSDISGTQRLQLGEVHLGGEMVTRTDFQGHFTLLVPKDAQRLVLTFKDVVFDAFFRTTKVINLRLSKDTKNVQYDFYLATKGPSIPVADQTTLTVPIRDTETHLEFGLKDEVLTTEVFLQIIPQNTSTYFRQSPESFHVMDMGDEFPLHVIQTLVISFERSKERLVEEMTLSIGTEAAVDETYAIWAFDAESGFWERASALKKDNRSESSGFTGFITVEDFGDLLSGDTIWLVIGAIGQTCHIGVAPPPDVVALPAALSLQEVNASLVTYLSTWLVSERPLECVLVTCGNISAIVQSGTVPKQTTFPSFTENATDCATVINTASEAPVETLPASYSLLPEIEPSLFRTLHKKDLYMAWNPMSYKNEYKACFLKVYLNCSSPAVLKVFSFGGSHQSTLSRLYGVRSSFVTTGGESVCAEYKCSGPLYTGLPRDVDQTLVQLETSSEDCRPEGINPRLAQLLALTTGRDETAPDGGRERLALVLPEGVQGSSFGLYAAFSTLNYEDAVSKSLSMCGGSPEDAAAGAEMESAAVLFSSTIET